MGLPIEHLPHRVAIFAPASCAIFLGPLYMLGRVKKIDPMMFGAEASRTIAVLVLRILLLAAGGGRGTAASCSTW
jgi:hypothetical protein